MGSLVQTCMVSVILLLLLCWGSVSGLDTGTAQERLDDSDITREIQREIIEITKSTKESRREANVKNYEKIFLRLAATGLQAAGRNILYATTKTVFQGDDDEEEETKRRDLNIGNVNLIESWMDDSELEATGRSQFVPQIFGEPLFYVPSSYWLQVIGRSLTGAAFTGSSVLGIKSLELRCSVENWNTLVSTYMTKYSPIYSPLSTSELRFRLSQFLRDARTQLSCLVGTESLYSLLDQLSIVLGDQLDQRVAGEGVISDDVMENTIHSIYDAIDSVSTSISSDWLTSSSVTTTLLGSKLVGFTLITWGRNIGDWPVDVPVTEVSTGYKVGIMGRALLYTLFVIDDFRKLEGYIAPVCGAEDVYKVLSKYSNLLYAEPGYFTEVQRRIKVRKFQFDLESSLACLTSTPGQFEPLDSLQSPHKAIELRAKIQDLVDIVQLKR